MQRIFNRYITQLLQLHYKRQLPAFEGNYSVSPKPNYLSQFVGIYPSSITPDTLLTDKQHIREFGAKDAKELSFWTWRDCGIVCVKMILSIKNKAKNRTIMDLTHEGINLGGYILYEKGKFVDKGWFHHALVKLLAKYGVTAQMKKWQTIESVAKDILDNKMVILSVLVPGRRSIKEDGSFEPKAHATFGGHLLLAVGVKMKGKEVEGVYVHDPRGLEKYQKDTFISKKVFNKIFSQRTIVAS